MENLAIKVRERLLKEAEKDYKQFSASLIPNINNVLGIRIPTLRKIAKEIYTEYGIEYLKVNDCEYMEEIMLQGILIGTIKDKPEIILKYVENFVPKINNWATCDIVCASLKFTKKNKELVWDFIQPYLNSDKEYELRFAIVMILGYFIEDNYIDKILSILDKIHHDAYYTKMAVAWALSICYVKQPEKTHKYLTTSSLPKWTYNKAIQKTCESFRVDKNIKEILKTMKK